MKHIVMTGDPASGFYFHGPFDEIDDATLWAEKNMRGENWWIVPLEAPTS